MASVERPSFTQAIPATAKRIVRDGKPYATWTNRKLQTVVAPILPTGKCRVTVAKTWIGIYRDHTGKRKKTKPFGDRSAALSTALDAEKAARAVREGRAVLGRPTGKLLLIDHLKAYLGHLDAAGVTPKHRKERETDLRRVILGAALGTAGAVDIAALDRWLERERRSGNRRSKVAPTEQPPQLSARTRNRWVQSLKAFGAWLEAESRVEVNPFRRLKRLNEEADQRHVRRTITPAEVGRLIDGTAKRPKRRGLSGADRSMLYLIAVGTGFRIGTLNKLTPENFVVEDGVAVSAITNASMQKSRKAHGVPIPADIGPRIEAWLKGKKPGKLLWQWSSYTAGEAVRVLRGDLKAAGIPYRDAAGEVFDFHALRGQYITMLIAAGNSSGVVQKLAGHSDPRLTARYTRLRSPELAAAVDKLPSLGAPLGSKGGGKVGKGIPAKGETKGIKRGKG
jgi:integrase